MKLKQIETEKTLRTLKAKRVAGRFVISKSTTKKKGFFTEMVVYKRQISKGKFSSQTCHERI